MSGKDDPFGSGGKTVIRPNPAGRVRPVPGQGSATDAGGPLSGATVAGAPMPGSPPQQPSGSPPPQSPIGTPQPPVSPASAWGIPARPSHPPPQSYSPMPAQNEAARYGMPGSDDWMHSGRGSVFFPNPAEQQAPSAPREKIPLDVALNARDGGEYAASNPLTAAAAPLLILLGRLRLMIVDMQAVPLMNHVAQEIRDFEKRAGEAGASAEDVMVAKYALCGTADDIVQNLPGTDRHVWMQYSMLAQFFQVRTSGVGFFEELKKILANPAPRYNLLELMHACLALGFEGQYRGAAGGDVQLQRWRRDVYQTLRSLRTRSDDDISPRWQGMVKLLRDTGAAIPLWVIAGVVGAGLVGVFFLLRFIISGDGDSLAARLIALNPAEAVTIERAAFAPMPDLPVSSTQLERIRAALKDDIAAGGIAVEPVGDKIVVQVNNLLLFASGRADVRKEFQPIAERIAGALDKEPGPIHVIGHTDNVKPKASGAFKSNFDLSVARAKAVEKIIGPKLSDPSRVSVEGRGEDEPIDDNKTAEGRSKNRRVEVMIPRAEE
ncbi:type VI secretion system protein TssL, long form [Mesorhizobium sp. LHD-90]|uniref:type VI secretion system protein TssL, long form n=1 Tax=Mesorhizobium sp. LHD-90 TaxID=3071414 RepID=UPI0027DF2EFD|nr:type VI secretion system protein TssL, long form [Mesorhizobium sp. LHD-90]MDQ6434696.1 type VI secretion system protein TssL, long form [Mesorhizobium sp. LHD-90]